MFMHGSFPQGYPTEHYYPSIRFLTASPAWKMHKSVFDTKLQEDWIWRVGILVEKDWQKWLKLAKSSENDEKRNYSFSSSTNPPNTRRSRALECRLRNTFSTICTHSLKSVCVQAEPDCIRWQYDATLLFVLFEREDIWSPQRQSVYVYRYEYRHIYVSYYIHLFLFWVNLSTKIWAQNLMGQNVDIARKACTSTLKFLKLSAVVYSSSR